MYYHLILILCWDFNRYWYFEKNILKQTIFLCSVFIQPNSKVHFFRSTYPKWEEWALFWSRDVTDSSHKWLKTLKVFSELSFKNVSNEIWLQFLTFLSLDTRETDLISSLKRTTYAISSSEFWMISYNIFSI